MKRVILIVDRQITLKQFIPNDAAAIFALIDCNREHLNQFGDDTAQKYLTEDSVYESILCPADAYRLRFGIWDGNVFVGTINLTQSNDFHEGLAAEIGYWIGSQFQGKGYIGRAVQRLVQYAFDEMHIDALYGFVVKGNERSMSVLTKAGFQRGICVIKDNVILRLERNS